MGWVRPESDSRHPDPQDYAGYSTVVVRALGFEVVSGYSTVAVYALRVRETPVRFRVPRHSQERNVLKDISGFSNSETPVRFRVPRQKKILVLIT